MGEERMSAGSQERIVRALAGAAAKLEAAERRRTEPIAIVGMACRFPGSDSLAEFWAMLRDGRDAITPIPPERWDVDAYFDADREARGRSYTRHGAFLRDVDQFDADLFGISPREADSVDPQQRILLEVSLDALYAAGLTRDAIRDSNTGVFVGVTMCDYGYLLMRSLYRLDSYGVTGNALNATAGRLSYVYGLRGPSMAIDTACSSSLVAIHTACQSLRAGDCDAALAAGINLMLNPDAFVAMAKAGVLSSDGRCRPFDAAAAGIGRGEGCGVLVLKRLSDAERDGDRIEALIRGSAVNQDGPSAGFTVPSGTAQADVIQRALAQARLEPGAIDYVEAHGTGTRLGDPIEVGALARVFGADRTQEQPLMVGAVKGNIAHGESAAGVAGVIKTALALQHEQIPAVAGYRSPSPHIDWSAPIRIATELTPWTRSARLRAAGVSGFGVSGTNAHVVISEAPLKVAAVEGPDDHASDLLLVSGASGQALREGASRVAQFLSDQPQHRLSDVCYSAATARDHYSHRAAIAVRSRAGAIAALNNLAAGEPHPDVTQGVARGATRSTSTPASASVADRYVNGAGIDWRALYENRGAVRITLPPYPYQRQRHWFAPAVIDSLPLRDGAYEIDWRHEPLFASVSTPARWLILNDSGGEGQRVADAARKAGHDVTTLDRERGSELGELLASFSASPHPFHVVHFWSLDIAAGTAWDEALAAGVESALRVVQATARGRGRAWIVTKAAQSVKDGRVQPLQAPVWGLGRTAAIEHPHAWGGLIDLDDASPIDPMAIVSEVEAGTGDTQAAYRRGTRYVARLKRIAIAAPSTLTISPERSYIVTGASGAVGLQAIGWLVSLGAKHLVLAARRSPDAAVASKISAIAPAARFINADIAEPAAALELVSAAATLAPLGGVLHAAGTIDDGVLQQLDADRLAGVMSGKARGALNLDAATRGLPLDFFILFSSLSSVLGSPGQGNYAAANAFLDALAASRRQRGDAACSINWGPWAGAGMAADRIENLRARGLTPWAPNNAFAFINVTGAGDRAQVVAAHLDAGAIRGGAPAARLSILDGLTGEERRRPDRAAGMPTTQAAMVSYLSRCIAAIQGLAGDEMPVTDASLQAQGLDSMMATELRNRVASDLRVDLPIAILLSGATVEDVAARLFKDRGPASVAGQASDADTEEIVL
jgi:acyl transferase domain-containing protein